MENENKYITNIFGSVLRKAAAKVLESRTKELEKEIMKVRICRANIVPYVMKS